MGRETAKMRAAIYARKSTDDSDRHEDNRSVTRQTERAQAFCKARGWVVSDDHVFVDDGISGAEYQNRPGLLRLMAALKGFDTVVMSEISRLGRDMVRNAVVIDEIRSAGVQIWYCLTGEQEQADTPEQRIMVTLRSFAAEVERAKSSQRTRDALERKALRGQNVGGRVYGYRNVWVMEDGRRVPAGPGIKKPEAVVRTEYEIAEHEVEVLRGIFRAYAAGHGCKAIAKALNGDPRYEEISARYFAGAKPAPPWKGSGSWAPSSIYAMLRNERYLGKIPYGESRKIYRQGTRKRIRQEAYHLVDAPHLQIIDEDLWQSVRSRSGAARREYLSATGGEPHGRPRTSRYLLSGLMRCSCCTGSMVATSATVGYGRTRRQVLYYLCSYRHHRGATVCTNAITARAHEAEERLLSAIETKVLTPAAIDFVIDLTSEQVLAARRSAPDRRAQIEEDIKRLQRELDRFMAVIAAGQAPQSVLAEIVSREERTQALKAELATLSVASIPGPHDLARIRAAIIKRATHFREALRRDVPSARDVLLQLLPRPILFIPDDAARSGYRLEGETVVGPLFGQVWRPQGDTISSFQLSTSSAT